MRGDLYAVVEHNQASRQPDDQGVTFLWNLDEAVEHADSLTAENCRRWLSDPVSVTEKLGPECRGWRTRGKRRIAAPKRRAPSPDQLEFNLERKNMDTATTTATNEVLCDNEWLALHVIRDSEAGIDGYVYSHETRCKGRIIAVLPYADRPEGRRYLVKSEVTPCWSLEPELSAMTGGYEGGDPEDDAVREMLEETGYTIDRSDLISLGESFASKSSDTVYLLFGVDLTGRDPGEALGDGSRLEAESTTAWLTFAELTKVGDPQVSVMFLRLAHRGVAA